MGIVVSAVDVSTITDPVEDARLADFLRELTELTHRYGYVIEAETEHGYSCGDYGIVALERDIYDGKACYGYSRYNGKLEYRPWRDGSSMWSKQIEWDKTILPSEPMKETT